MSRWEALRPSGVARTVFAHCPTELRASGGVSSQHKSAEVFLSEHYLRSTRSLSLQTHRGHQEERLNDGGATLRTLLLEALLRNGRLELILKPKGAARTTFFLSDGLDVTLRNRLERCAVGHAGA